jgi:myo-inositol catabolism protein IolC
VAGGELSDAQFTEAVAANFRALIQGWRQSRTARHTAEETA